MQATLLLFFTSCLCAYSATTSDLPPLKDLSAYLRDKRPAFIKVFVDSEAKAPEADVAELLERLPKLAGHFEELRPALVRLYAEHCRETRPSDVVEEMDVCPGVIKTTTTDFGAFVSKLSEEEVLEFYLLPPGGLRDAIRNHLETFPEKATDLAKKLSTPFPKLPFPEALDSESDFFDKFLTKASVQFIVDILSSPDFKSHTTFDVDRMKSHMDEKQRECLSAVLPDDTLAYLWESVKQGNKQRLPDLIVSILNTFIRPLPSVFRKQPIRRLANIVWTALQEADLPDGHVAHFEAIFGKIISLHPEFAFLDCASLELPAFKSFDVNRLVLEAAAARKSKGTFKVHEFDGETVLWLDDAIEATKCEWRQRHYRRLLLRLPTDTDTDTAAKYNSNDSQNRPRLHAHFGDDIMSKMDALQGTVATKYRRDKYSVTPKAPTNFFRLVTESHDHVESVIAEFVDGVVPAGLTVGEVALAGAALDEMLTVEQRDTIMVKGYQRAKKEKCSTAEPEPNYRQRALLNSLFLRHGSFESSEDDAYVRSLEAVATIFFPVYTNKLMTAVTGSTRNIEDLFECPFVDKGWLVEFYGNIFVPLQDPTCILRLCDPKNTKVTIAFQEYVGRLFNRSVGCIEYDQYNPRLRIVELIKHLHSSSGQIDTIMHILCRLTTNKDAIIDALQSKKTTTTVSCKSDEALLIAFLSDFQQVFSDTDDYLSMFPLAMAYPRHQAVHTLSHIIIDNDMQMIDLDDQWHGWADLPKRQSVIDNVLTQLWPSHEPSFVVKAIAQLPYKPAAKIVSQLFEAGLNTAQKCRLMCRSRFAKDKTMCVEFRMFVAESDGGSVVEGAVVEIWGRLFRETKDVTLATTRLVDSFQTQLTKEMVEEMVNRHYHVIPAADFINKLKVPFNRILAQSKTAVPVFVNNRMILLPSNADASHLYAAVQVALDMTAPFRIVHASGNRDEIPFDAVVSVRELSGVELRVECVNIFRTLLV